MKNVALMISSMAALAMLLVGHSLAPARSGAAKLRSDESSVAYAAPAPAPAAALAASVEEMRAVAAKVSAGGVFLDGFWGAAFNMRRLPYTTPRIAPYTGQIRTSCGPVGANNAYYCPNDHTIYYDVLFLARMMRTVGAGLGTDGDMAPITIIAHEWGHAVQRQLGLRGLLTIGRELQADCLAGAFVRGAYQARRLDPGDVEEARFVLAMGGDELPWFHKEAHGRPAERVNSFLAGLNEGASACGCF
jgi:predicted metalloprotease